MAKRKINKTQLIKDAIVATPEAKPKEIAAKLKKYGITATYVSNVKGKMDLNAEMQSGATASTGNTVGRPATATNSLDAAIKFVEQSGGLKAAKAAIEKIERIKSL
ncbi:MAG TPA: hypothetical protein VMM76_14270 [Pirellulaceae bacterium]|nr:hypothetical protein [Pirellulaceae bacterium]